MTGLLAIRVSRRSRRQRQMAKYRPWPKDPHADGFDLGYLRPDETVSLGPDRHIVVKDQTGHVVREWDDRKAGA